MTVVIKPKRSFTANAVPTGLIAYELAVNAASPAKMWIGSADGKSSVLISSLAISDHTGTTDNLTQGSTNKFYSDSLARAAISSTATGLTYTSSTGAISLTSGYSIPTTGSQTNWDSAYTQRLQWDGGATNLVAATGRISLGATTVGGNLFTLTNPAAITFPRFNVDNTVTALNAADFRTAIGAGTSSTAGTVTSVAALTLGTTGTDLSSTVATGTSTPVITLNVPTASALNRGVLSSSDFSNFSTAYTNRITSLTTTGASGAATLTTNTLNIPNYTLAGLGGIKLADLSSTATGLTYTNTTGVFSLTSGYAIPTTAKQTQWDTAYSSYLQWDGGTTGLVAATARTSLGLVIGTNVQAWDADLDAIAAITGTTGILKKTAANTWSLDTSTYLTGNQTVTLSGDVTGSGTTSITTTLGTVPITKGGTGQITANASLNALLPTQTSNSGKYLTTNGTDSSWASVSSGATIPSGSLQMYAGAITQSASAGTVTTTAPSGWLLANGDIVSRSTYSALFTAIGTTYGAGDGSTTFALPDMRSRVPVGVGTGSGLTARTLGGTVGEENTTVGATNLPSHSHTFSPTGTLNTENSHYHASANAGGHQHTGTNGWQPLVFTSTGGGAALNAGTSFQRYNMESVMNSAGDHSHGNTNVNSGHTHTFTPTAGQTTGNGPGTGASLTNMQPSIGMNYIIKT